MALSLWLDRSWRLKSTGRAKPESAEIRHLFRAGVAFFLVI